MKVDDRSKKVERVLAMFDPEDIPYICPNKRFKMIPYNKENITMDKPKVRKVGVYYDRSRK